MRLAINGFQKPEIRSEISQKKLDKRFVEAIKAKDWKKASELLEHGANMNARNEWGFPVLIAIASSGPKSLLDLTIEKDTKR